VPAPRLKLPKAMNVLGAYALERFDKWRGAEVKLDPHEVEIGEHWFWLDASKAKAELGYEPRDVYETLHDTVQYVMSKMAPGNLPGLKGRLAESRGGNPLIPR
jgi:dihydroflavonol-4-reductase